MVPCLPDRLLIAGKVEGEVGITLHPVLLAPFAHPARSDNLKGRSGRPRPITLHSLHHVGSRHDVPKPEARGELQADR